jgi:hypothetical protein
MEIGLRENRLVGLACSFRNPSILLVRYCRLMIGLDLRLQPICNDSHLLEATGIILGWLP